MSKKIIGIAIAAIMLFVFFFLTACTKNLGGDEIGKFYTLQEAYDKGFLSVTDLKSIASHHADRTYPVDVLSKKVMKKIKEVAARNMRESEFSPVENAKAEDFTIIKYYGTYNGSVVIMVKNSYLEYPAVDLDIDEIIEGVLFNYNTPNRIIVWRQNELN